jgi:hypothetical protein
MSALFATEKTPVIDEARFWGIPSGIAFVHARPLTGTRSAGMFHLVIVGFLEAFDV